MERREFEVGKWYPTRSGEKRYIIGKSPDGKRLLTCEQTDGGNLYWRELDGKFPVGWHGEDDLVHPPQVFDAEIELAVNKDGKVLACWPGNLAYLCPLAVGIRAKTTIRVTLTDGEGL